MDRQYVLVTGNGITSRANLEALMEDYFYAKGPEIVLVLAFENTPSQGQVFASQLAKDKNKDTIIFAHSDASFSGLMPATFEPSSDPIKEAVKFIADGKSSAFILWDDEDPISLKSLSECSNFAVKALDLTDGLNLIKANLDIKEAETPNIPEIEATTSDAPVEQDEEDEEDEEDEDDEELEEDELLDDIYFGVQSLAKYIAQEVSKQVVEELQKALNRGKKGSKE